MGKYKKCNIWDLSFEEYSNLADGWYLDYWDDHTWVKSGIMVNRNRSLKNGYDIEYYDLKTQDEEGYFIQISKQKAKRLIKQRTTPLGKVLLGETDA